MTTHEIKIKVAIVETDDRVAGTVQVDASPEELARFSPRAIAAISEAVGAALADKHTLAVGLALLEEAAAQTEQSRAADKKSAARRAHVLAKLLQRGGSQN